MTLINNSRYLGTKNHEKSKIQSEPEQSQEKSGGQFKITSNPVGPG